MRPSISCICTMPFVEVFHHTAIGRANHATSCWLNPRAQTWFSSIQLKSGSSIQIHNRRSNRQSLSSFIHWRNAGLKLCDHRLTDICSTTKQSQMSIHYFHGMTCLNNHWLHMRAICLCGLLYLHILCMTGNANRYCERGIYIMLDIYILYISNIYTNIHIHLYVYTTK